MLTILTWAESTPDWRSRRQRLPCRLPNVGVGSLLQRVPEQRLCRWSEPSEHVDSQSPVV
jgi:hypothetical protein